MNDIKILIVEDESIVAMEIGSYLQILDYTIVGICSSAQEALDTIAKKEVHIVLMDIFLKGVHDGIETAEYIKKSHPHIKVIFLTAHMDEYNIDRAIKLNPIAYLSKPFRREELRAFLKIASHKIYARNPPLVSKENYTILNDEFYYDKKSGSLFHCGELIHLTKKEHTLLSIFIENKNIIIDLYTISNLIWPEKEISTNTIRTLVRRVREKLNHQFIETLSSQGYMLAIK